MTAASSWPRGTDKVAAVPALVVTHRESPVPLGPVDERVLNPIGFVADASGPVVELPADTMPTEALVRTLRAALGVTVTGRDALWQPVAGLAMAGVPLVTEALDADVARRLGPEVRPPSPRRSTSPMRSPARSTAWCCAGPR